MKIKNSPNILGTLSGLDASTITSIFYGKSKNTGLATIKAICDGRYIILFDFCDVNIFKTADMDIYLKFKARQNCLAFIL